MIEELHILGVYMPAALAWGVLAAVLVHVLRKPLQRLPLYQWLWHPALVDLALFVTLWWGLSAFADTFLHQWRYRLALEQANANIASQQAALAQAVREDRRNRAMPEALAAETIEQGRAKVEQLRAAMGQAVAARDLAQFNLERTLVRAPVDGTISNMTLQPGVYLTAGKPALARV